MLLTERCEESLITQVVLLSSHLDRVGQIRRTLSYRNDRTIKDVGQHLVESYSLQIVCDFQPTWNPRQHPMEAEKVLACLDVHKH